jgi:hypothetical protein
MYNYVYTCIFMEDLSVTALRSSINVQVYT